jgi:hypothetical protein
VDSLHGADAQQNISAGDFSPKGVTKMFGLLHISSGLLKVLL